jgi:hypothetical protein
VDELASLEAPSLLLLLLLLLLLVGAVDVEHQFFSSRVLLHFFPTETAHAPPFAAAAVAVLVLVLVLRAFANAVSIDWVHSSWGCGDCDCDQTVNGRTMLAAGCC